jgi:hypothetical protein
MRWTLLLAAVWLGSCGSDTTPGGHACTLIGCVDQYTAQVSDASGGLPAGAYTLAVTADGAMTTCSFTLPLAKLPSGGTMGIDCPSGLTVIITQGQTCTTMGTAQYQTQTCTPVAGELTETISIAGKPTTLHVTQTVNGATVLDQMVTPAYTTTRPNGPDCDPVCSQASARWTLTAT